MDDATCAEVRRRDDTAAAPATRLRYQVVWRAPLGQRVPRIAQTVLPSADTVSRLLHRFRDGGLDAVPRRPAPGGAPTITPAWTAELGRVIDLDPPTVGVPSANGTTGLLATSLADRTGVAVRDERGRQALPAHDYVCTRPTWTLQRRAQEQAAYLGNA